MSEPTTDRLRHDITRGRAGDKVAHPDPAAAPLGTDDEAAGTPPQPREIRLARRYEIKRGVGGDESDHGVTIYVAVVASLISIVSLAIWLF